MNQQKLMNKCCKLVQHDFTFEDFPSLEKKQAADFEAAW